MIGQNKCSNYTPSSETVAPTSSSFFSIEEDVFNTLNKKTELKYQTVLLSILTCYFLHTYCDWLRFGTGFSNSIHIDSPNPELVLPIGEKVLDVVRGAVTGGEITPCVFHRVPDLQVVGLDDAAPIVSRAVPGEGQ